MTDAELQRKIARYRVIAKSMGIPDEMINARVGGLGTGGGGGAGDGDGKVTTTTGGSAATGTTEGLISPESVYGVKGVGKAESERTRAIALMSLRKDMKDWNFDVTRDRATGQSALKEMVTKYGRILEPSEITSEWDAFMSQPGTWGPHGETTETIESWRPKKTPSGFEGL